MNAPTPIRLLVAALVGAFALAAAPAGAQTKLTVAAYGGSYEEMMRKEIIPAFEKKTGAKVEYVAGNSTDNIARMQAQRANQEIDVAIVDDGPMYPAVALGLCGDLKGVNFAELSAMKVARITRGERYFLLQRTGDEVLDWREAVAYYGGARQCVLGGGDHGWADFAPEIPAVLRFAGVDAAAIQLANHGAGPTIPAAPRAAARPDR